jgi:GAF domain-containing protein
LIVFYSSQIGNAQATDWLSASVTILILSAIIILGFQKLQTEIIDGQKQINIVLGKLADERNHLEERVKVRTADLQTADKNSRRRAGQFEAIAQVAHAIASIQELDTLLFRVTQLISQQFGNYHTGVFLLDEEREYAVLRAANSDGGQRMLSRGHRLRVGQTGIVGYVAGTENPRIALDTGEDVVYFNNPDLPDTHSELALPLRVAGQLIGVLDVQSVEANAFNQEDVEVLSTLADQVSIAIQNARFFRETQKLLVETQSATSNYIVDAWKVLRPTFARIGYQKSGNLVKPLEKLLEGEHIRQALENGETVAQSSNLTVPIRLRGQIIGVMNLQVPQNHTWNSDEVDIAEAVAERLSLAIETSTLLKATQHRADIERVTADIAGKLSSSTRFETILQTAAQELSRALGGSDVLVQLEPVSMKMQSDI